MKSQTKTAPIWLAGLLACAALTRTEAAVTVGQPFPALASYGLTNNLPDQTGRVVLIDFWASWCAPCRASFPAYDALQHELGERGLTIIGVSVDESENQYTRFMTRYAPSFATVRDIEQKFVTAVRPSAMPTCYLIDRHGVVRTIHSGFHGNATVRELHEEIIKLLEEKP
jgi:thiol-disulfide isomerase/thioredoxin